MEQSRKVGLNVVETAQLGTVAKNGVRYFASEEEWLAFREKLTKKSARRNKDFFDATLSAYTPGETEALLKDPRIEKWFSMLSSWSPPSDVDAIILVPCAASKPWRNHPSVSKSLLYKGYNKVVDAVENEKLPKLYFMTVSEPLGLVPQEFWNDFPKYDNPGLFSDDFLRTGMTKQEWVDSEYGEKVALPFDQSAYARCIERLSSVIDDVLARIDVPVHSFVDAKEGTTHGAMLNGVKSKSISRHQKKGKSRSEPSVWILEQLAKAGVVSQMEMLSAISSFDAKETTKPQQSMKSKMAS